MKIKEEKKKKFSKKIILLIIVLGILSFSIVAPIVVINNNKKNKNLDKVNEIITKIKDKDILILPNVSNQNQSEIQNAIKNQLKKENQTLNEDDLSKIYINNIRTLTFGKKIEITVTIKVKNTIKELKINVEKINLLKSSNINEGEEGMIFQDSFKNLWAMSGKKSLQVLKANDSKDGYVSEGWTDNTKQKLLNGSNINESYGGTIFQDSFKNLWAIGYETPLQVLKVNDSKNGYVPTGWTNDIAKGLTKASNINDGEGGTIFQDSFKNLWAMGYGKPLQVLKVNSNGDGYVSEGWTDNTKQKLLNGSNINESYGGTIFQDSFKNLWAMAAGTKLQVLKVNSGGNGYVESWTNNTQRLTKGSNITNGFFGKIFQDSFRNLWTMGFNTPLQVLKANSGGTGYVPKGWTNKNTEDLLNGSNSTHSNYGTIFQDSFKNLWTMEKNKKLQVLKANSNGTGYVNTWVDNNYINSGHELLKNSNIDDGESGTIFQDSFGNLWAMGKGTNLQVLKINDSKNGYVSEGWTKDINDEILNCSNIANGFLGTIFQDSFKNLWAIGYRKPLQVLIANLNNTGYLNSWI